MTPASIRAAVSRIATLAIDDPEMAHRDEILLWQSVLVAIATGAESPAALAAEALKTRMLKFPRRCA